MSKQKKSPSLTFSLGAAASVLAGLVLLTVDAVQTFQHNSLRVYIEQASSLANAVQQWCVLR